MSTGQTILGHPLIAEILATWPDAEIKIVEPNDFEIEAIQTASEKAGAYIESLGQTDMAKWSYEQWMTFLETVYTSTRERLRQLHMVGNGPIGDDDIPF